MAVPGYIGSLLNALPDEIKKVLVPAFEYLSGNWRLGDGARAQNAVWYAFEATTSSDVGAEFSVLHGMDSIPTKFIPVVDLTAIGSQSVIVSVSRAPDARRVYFRSLSTGAVFSGYFE